MHEEVPADEREEEVEEPKQEEEASDGSSENSENQDEGGKAGQGEPAPVPSPPDQWRPDNANDANAGAIIGETFNKIIDNFRASERSESDKSIQSLSEREADDMPSQREEFTKINLTRKPKTKKPKFTNKPKTTRSTRKPKPNTRRPTRRPGVGKPHRTRYPKPPKPTRKPKPWLPGGHRPGERWRLGRPKPGRPGGRWPKPGRLWGGRRLSKLGSRRWPKPSQSNMKKPKRRYTQSPTDSKELTEKDEDMDGTHKFA